MGRGREQDNRYDFTHSVGRPAIAQAIQMLSEGKSSKKAKKRPHAGGPGVFSPDGCSGGKGGAAGLKLHFMCRQRRGRSLVPGNFPVAESLSTAAVPVLRRS